MVHHLESPLPLAKASDANGCTELRQGITVVDIQCLLVGPLCLRNLPQRDIAVTPIGPGRQIQRIEREGLIITVNGLKVMGPLIQQASTIDPCIRHVRIDLGRKAETGQRLVVFLQFLIQVPHVEERQMCMIFGPLCTLVITLDRFVILTRLGK